MAITDLRFFARSTLLILLLLSGWSTTTTAAEHEETADAVASEASPSNATVASSIRVAGYLPDYRYDGAVHTLTATAEHLDDLYLFSLSPQTSLGVNMFAVCCLRDKHYEQARQARDATNGRLKLWVTVGGGGRSSNFVKNPSAMITALQKLTKEEELDGVDFDCEHFSSHEDYVEYESLVKNAAYVLHKEGISISVALHVGQTMPLEIYDLVDRINLMTYDMAGVSYHADFGKMREAVAKLVDSGCPKSKIFVGVPGYGRDKRDPSQVQTYAELVAAAVASDTDDTLTATELNKRYAYGNYLVDSPAAVRAKARYAQREGLGGIFLWELGHDDTDASKHSEALGGRLIKAAAALVNRTAMTEATKPEKKREIYKQLKNNSNDEL